VADFAATEKYCSVDKSIAKKLRVRFYSRTGRGGEMENIETPRRRRRWPYLAGVLIALLIIYTQLTIFVIPPMGMMPNGGTIVMLRLNKTEFVDSPDAMCERIQGGVSLLCRGMAMGAVGQNRTEIMRLPYSQTLYLISTDGKAYDR
jgi:hypothetical protein